LYRYYYYQWPFCVYSAQWSSISVYWQVYSVGEVMLHFLLTCMPASFHYEVMLGQTQLAWSHSFSFKCLYQAKIVSGPLYVFYGYRYCFCFYKFVISFENFFFHFILLVICFFNLFPICHCHTILINCYGMYFSLNNIIFNSRMISLIRYKRCFPHQ
jgi:hypothetical protein